MKTLINNLLNNKHLRIYYLLIISLIFVSFLYFVYEYSRNNIEKAFVHNKNIISESLTKHYSDFINRKLPEFSLYNGYLDSTSIIDFVNSTFSEYDFVNKIIYYDTFCTVSPKNNYQDFKDHLKLSCEYILVFNRKGLGPHYTKQRVKFEAAIPEFQGDFNQMRVKFNAFIHHFNLSGVFDPEDISKNFFNISGNKITYMNVPSSEDLNIFKQLSAGQVVRLVNNQIHQDIISVSMVKEEIKTTNSSPKLYDHIKTLPSLFVPIRSVDSVYTFASLPGALSDYKLMFISSKRTLSRSVWLYFLPLAFVVIILYVCLIFIISLIFRNIRMSEKMFTMQYSFINNLTHEFKTPVSVIKIAGNNLKKEKLVSDEERINYAKILDEEADKLNQMVNKILSFTQIENKSIQVNIDKIDLSEFILSTIEIFQVKYPDFEMTYTTQAQNTIYTDAILLGSIFDNLFENAYKYSPLNRKKIHILVQKNKGHVSISFTDKGIGIPRNEIDNIFKKFYRIESTYNQNGSVGLGLAFCKEVSHLLGGDIGVKSQLSEGSEFVLTLPIKITNEYDR